MYFHAVVKKNEVAPYHTSTEDVRDTEKGWLLNTMRGIIPFL